MLLHFLASAKFVFKYEDARLKKTLDKLKVVLEVRMPFENTIEIMIIVANFGISLSLATTVPNYMIGYYQNKVITTTIPHYKAMSNSSKEFEQFTISIEKKHLETELLHSIIIHEVLHGMGIVSSIGDDYSGRAGAVLMQSSELVFMPPTYFDLLLYQNNESLYDVYFSKLEGLCWNKVNPFNKKPLDDIKGRVGTFLHSKCDRNELRGLATSPFTFDEYFVKTSNNSKHLLYFMDGWIDRYFIGFKIGSSFDHIQNKSSIMNYKGNSIHLDGQGIDNIELYLQNDPVWDILCAMGYKVPNMTCAALHFHNFKPLYDNKTLQFCSEYLDLDLYDIEIRYWVSPRGLIIFLIVVLVISLLVFACKSILKLRKRSKKRPLLKVVI
eukprot:NODE_169_length_16247_cov_0.185348.p4 type:complete len:383 gc:universal NODE_169_length_16247_cov_0.185348:12859-11711(-)